MRHLCLEQLLLCAAPSACARGLLSASHAPGPGGGPKVPTLDVTKIKVSGRSDISHFSRFDPRPGRPHSSNFGHFVVAAHFLTCESACNTASNMRSFITRPVSFNNVSERERIELKVSKGLWRGVG